MLVCACAKDEAHVSKFTLLSKFKTGQCMLRKNTRSDCCCSQSLCTKKLHVPPTAARVTNSCMYYQQLHVLPTSGNPAAAQGSHGGAADGEVKEEGKKQAKQEGANGEQGKEDRMVPVSQPKAESGQQRDGNALQPAGRKVFCACCV